MEDNTVKPGLFEKGGKLGWLHSSWDAFDTFLRVPATVTAKGAHIRDAVDIKRVMIIVVLALVPAALFGMWNVGYQHNLAAGDLPGFWNQFFWGLLKVIPLYLVSYIVGLGIEFASAQIKGEEVNEGYLVSGMIIPLIVPVDVPLWMLAIAVAFAVIFGKEVFGGTGMNFLNPALLCHIVGGDEDGYATLGGIVYELPELSACGGVHTASRLVEKHNLRFVEDSYREGELLFPS